MWKIVLPLHFSSLFFSFSSVLLWIILFVGCLKATRVEISFVRPSVNHFRFQLWMFFRIPFSTNKFRSLRYVNVLYLSVVLIEPKTFKKESNGRKRNNQIYLLERSILFLCLTHTNTHAYIRTIDSLKHLH